MLSRDGLMVVDPGFVDKQFLGIKKNTGKLHTMLQNHYGYADSIRMWIHNIHREEETELLNKFLFGKPMKMPWSGENWVPLPQSPQ